MSAHQLPQPLQLTHAHTAVMIRGVCLILSWGFMRAVWDIAWKRFNVLGQVLGDVQGRVVATAFYFTILMPFALASRLFSDPLRQKNSRPTWLKRDPLPTDLDSARQQG